MAPPDLELDITPAVSASYAGDLSLEDLKRKDSAPSQPAGQRLKKLRDSHHALARALAQGLRNFEAAEIAGYSEVRVSILKDDPAFQQLIAHYREVKDEAFSDFQKQAASLTTDMLEELRERFEDQEVAGKMSNEFLIDTVTKLADRTGHGPRSTQVNINVDLAGRLEAARRRAGLVQVEGAPVLSLTKGEEGPVLDLLPNPSRVADDT